MSAGIRHVQLVNQIDDRLVRDREYWDFLHRRMLKAWVAETGQVTPQRVRVQRSAFRTRLVFESVLPL